MLLDFIARDGSRGHQYASHAEFLYTEMQLHRNIAKTLLRPGRWKNANVKDESPVRRKEDRPSPGKPRRVSFLTKMRKELIAEANADGDPTAAALENLVSFYQGNLGFETERQDSAEDDPEPRTHARPRIRILTPDYRARAAAQLEELLPLIRRAGAVGRRALVHVNHALAILNCED